MSTARAWFFVLPLALAACSGSETNGPDTPAHEPPAAEPAQPSTQVEPTDEAPADDDSADTEDGESPAFEVAGWQMLLDTYVTEDGGVRYEALRGNEAHVATLAALVEAVDRADMRGMPRDSRLAFYINAYNILTTHSVLERWPLESVMQSDGFFDGATHAVAGSEYTLNQLEGDVIRAEEFSEPRIHFAVNCASEGCPPLSRIAYTAENLEEQLARQADAFVRGTSRIERSEGRVQISQLLEWYADDFGGADGVRAFLVAHLEAEDAAFVRETSTRVEHFDYDWALNRR